MLGALVNEVPTQVRQRNDRRGILHSIPPAVCETAMTDRAARAVARPGGGGLLVKVAGALPLWANAQAGQVPPCESLAPDSGGLTNVKKRSLTLFYSFQRRGLRRMKQEGTDMKTGLKQVLDPTRMGTRAAKLHDDLCQRVIGQDDAIRQIVRVYQTFDAGLAAPGRPVGSLLFLGPTGSGKTRTVEALAESMVGDPRAVVKIDCAEF